MMIKNANPLKKEKDPRKSEKILINREFFGISSLEILIDVPKEKKNLFLSCKVNNNNRKYLHTFLLDVKYHIRMVLPTSLFTAVSKWEILAIFESR